MEIPNLIGSTLQIKVLDGRVLSGVLSVVDHFGNLLLVNVMETSIDPLNSALTHSRDLGLVSVPKDQIKSLLIEKKQLRNICPV